MFSWLVDTAHAMGTAPTGGEGAAQPSPVASMVPFILIMVVFYFLFFRPQQKKAKEHQSMIDAIQRGDEATTGGGIIGKVTAVTDEVITIEIADGVKIKVLKKAVANVKKGG